MQEGTLLGVGGAHVFVGHAGVVSTFLTVLMLPVSRFVCLYFINMFVAIDRLASGMLAGQVH